MILARRILLFAVLLAGTALPFQALADVLTLNPGLATQRLIDRKTDGESTFFNLLADISYQSAQWDVSLDLVGRWDTEENIFDDSVWNRRGDLLRPVETLMYHRPDGTFSAGLDRLWNWTPGGGYLIRDLSGYGEIDYVLPGFRLQWERGDLKMELGTDRPVDPTIQAAVVTWEPAGKIRFVAEGVVDPEAPESFTGEFSGGRPVAENDRRLSGSAAGFLFPLRDGQVLGIKAGAHAARLGDEASGLGWELRANFELSSYYLNRLSLGFGSVQCSGGYVPGWFEGFYPLRRWGLSGQPLLEQYPIDDGQADRRMEMYDARYELGSALRLRAGFDRFADESMTRGKLHLEIREPGQRGLQVAVWSQTDGPEEKLFTDDANLYSRISALYAFVPHMLLTFSYDRSWVFREDSPEIVPLTSFLLGVMYNISL